MNYVLYNLKPALLLLPHIVNMNSHLFFSGPKSVLVHTFPLKCETKSQLATLCLSLSLVWGRVVIVLVNERVSSLYKYSQGFLLHLNHQSTVTVQPSSWERAISLSQGYQGREGAGGGPDSNIPWGRSEWETLHRRGNRERGGGHPLTATHRPEATSWGWRFRESSDLVGRG